MFKTEFAAFSDDKLIIDGLARNDLAYLVSSTTLIFSITYLKICNVCFCPEFITEDLFELT